LFYFKKINFTLEQAMKTRRVVEVEFYSFFNLSGRWGWVVNAMLRLFFPWERELLPIAKEAEQSPVPV
jgi:hypothetical protein